MKIITIITVTMFALLPLAAQATDLPSKKHSPEAPLAKPFDWSGFYLGANGGYLSGKSSLDVSFLPSNREFDSGPYENKASPNGFLGGFQLGQNLQSGNFVYGFEIDGQISGVKGSSKFGPLFEYNGDPAPDGTFSDQKTSIDYFGTFRARTGITVDRLLIYVTAGGIVADRSDYNDTHFLGSFVYIAEKKALNFGWVIGGGLEFALNDKWSAKGEYLYYNLGERSLIGDNKFDPGSEYKTLNKFDLDGSIFRVGLNYHF